jgi:hypothetical protein
VEAFCVESVDGADVGRSATAANLAAVGITKVGPPRETNPPAFAMLAGSGGEERICSGLALNFDRQPALQKKYGFPL